MSTSRLRKRVYLIAAALLAAVAVFGCSHSDLGPYELGELPEAKLPEGLDLPEEVLVSLHDVRVHAIELEFATAMVEGSVKLDIFDDLGRRFEEKGHVWTPNGRFMTITGPFQFCHRYGLTILAGAQDTYQNVLEEDVFMEIPMGPNPYDFDRNVSCNADAVISPAFNDDNDAMILLGDDATGASGTKDMSMGDVTGDLVWFMDGSQFYDYADRMILIPNYIGKGTTGAAKLFAIKNDKSVDYELNVWSNYNAAYEEPSSTLYYNVPNTKGEEFTGPYDGGDLNGDGARELMIMGQMSTDGLNLMQRVFIIEGPIPTGVDANLGEVSATARLMGSLNGVMKPMVSVGDIDDDGFDDLAAITHNINEAGNTSNWRVKIYHGEGHIPNILGSTDLDEIVGAIGREIVEVGHGDLNGDGIEDLIVADVWKKYVYGMLKYSKPRVLVFFGGQNFKGHHVEEADVKITVDLSTISYINSLKAKVVGDINADGFEDLAIGKIEESAWGVIGNSDIYVVTGRTMFPTSVNLAPYSFTPKWALRIVSDSSRRIVLEDDRWDARVGDMDNDGHYDLLLKVLDYTGQEIMFYPGDSEIKPQDGREVELDEASASWSFSVRQ